MEPSSSASASNLEVGHLQASGNLNSRKKLDFINKKSEAD